MKPEPRDGSRTIERELALLAKMTPKQLREKYEAVWGEPSRSGNRRFLIKRIAWRIQADAEGDLPERVRQRAIEMARDSDLRTTAPTPRGRSKEAGWTVERVLETPIADDAAPAAGTQLERTYKGRTVVVDVLHDGFVYEGTKYRSLSGVAKAVTGSHLSGHAFFGLKGGRR